MESLNKIYDSYVNLVRMMIGKMTLKKGIQLLGIQIYATQKITKPFRLSPLSLIY